MGTADEPLVLSLDSLEGVKATIIDGRPTLVVTAAGREVLKVVTGDDHQADHTGLRRLRDGIGRLQQEVLSQGIQAERKARDAAAAVDLEWPPNPTEVAEAMRRITRREPAVQPSDFHVSGP